MSYHEYLGKNNRQKTEGVDKHIRRAFRLQDGQMDN